MHSPFIAPMLCLMLLTMLVWLTLFFKRIVYMQKQNIHAQKLNTPDKKHAILPDSVEQPAHNLTNLFELPVLFYALCLITMQLDIRFNLEILVALAWGFVVTRAIHSFIQCTYNRVMHRFIVYMLSSLMLWAMLIVLITAYFRL